MQKIGFARVRSFSRNLPSGLLFPQSQAGWLDSFLITTKKVEKEEKLRAVKSFCRRGTKRQEKKMHSKQEQ
jgi:hypothetical protein